MTNALLGLPTPRIPHTLLAVHFCATHAGISLRDYSTDAKNLAAAVLNYYEDFRPDAVWVSADTWVTAEAMGATIVFPGDHEPACGAGGPFIETMDDIAAIPPADPFTQGRQPVMLQALAFVREAIGSEAFVIGCFDQSPFSLACAMAGIDRLMMKLKVDPPFVEALLDRCVEYARAYGLAMAATGVDMLTTGDSPAGLIGPELYREVILPAEQRVCRTLRVGVLLRGTPGDVESACRAALKTVKAAGRRRFVLASGCTLAPATPADNVRAFLCSRDIH